MDLARERRLGNFEIFALALTLALLVAHAWNYRFLTDDAFISFRYARNLADGHGLVFNPGFERVEGYTNFLWVITLAGLARLGVAPEHAALPLSLLATVALWALVAGFAWRRRPSPRWLVAVPAMLLATTRSVAVWSTSGLETRAFEVLALAGVLRLVVEVERLGDGGRPRAFAGPLLALATLARPDGLLVSASVLGAATALLAVRRRLTRRWLVATALPYIALVGGHSLFRHFYYGQWLPNTYFAKVDGRMSWDTGAAYLFAFALEYAAYLWVLPIVAALVWHARRGTSHVSLLFAATVLPHALYVTAIGGDHFEYRPLDLLFPFAFLLIGDGIGVIARSRAGAWTAAACLAVLLAGLWTLPWQSHRQFPDRYAPGFPGLELGDSPTAVRYLAPERDPLYRLPGLRSIAATHQGLVRHLTSRFVAVRQEEHRLFLDQALAQGRRLRTLSDQGVLPRDTRVAISCVGAIPYVLDVYTLDRLGLTDAHVAHSAVALEEVLAHEKLATMAYARARGVDLWAADPVHLLVPITSKRLLVSMRESNPSASPAYAAEVSDSEYLLCQFPQGPDSAARRLPSLRFEDVRDPAFIGRYLVRATTAYETLLRDEPGNVDHARRLAFLVMVQGRFPQALALYRQVAAELPESGDTWENLALCEERLGDPVAALAALERARAIAVRSTDVESERRLLARIAALRAGEGAPAR